MGRFKHIIHTIDLHCAGEPTRVVLSGFPDLLGATMASRKREMTEHHDHLRALLMSEPRGHADMYGAVLTPPVSPGADAGLVFLDNGGYLDMCGHGTICAAVALAETGRAADPRVRFDTPAGPVDCRLAPAESAPGTVLLENAPAFVSEMGVQLDVPGLDRVTLDVAFGGNFFALVPAAETGLQLSPGNATELSRLGLEIRNSLNARLKVRHHALPDIDHVALTLFYEAIPVPDRAVRTVAVFGTGQIDRSPCGTGTSALMALMHARGDLAIGADLKACSIVDTWFTGRLLGTCEAGGIPAVRPSITGAAYMTGLHQFVLDPDDPLPRGFLLS